MAIEQDNLLEPVVGQRAGDVEHMMHEVLEVLVDGAGKIHDMAGVAIGNDREDKHLGGDFPAGAVGDSHRANEVDIQGQVVPMLLDRAAGHDADFGKIDGVFDLGPGQFLITVFRCRTAHT